MLENRDQLRAAGRIVLYALQMFWRRIQEAGSAWCSRMDKAKGASVIGAKLKLARAASGLSFDKLAAKVDGLPVARIKAFEHGEAMPATAEFKALAAGLGVSEWFLRDSPNIS